MNVRNGNEVTGTRGARGDTAAAEEGGAEGEAESPEREAEDWGLRAPSPSRVGARSGGRGKGRGKRRRASRKAGSDSAGESSRGWGGGRCEGRRGARFKEEKWVGGGGGACVCAN